MFTLEGDGWKVLCSVLLLVRLKDHQSSHQPFSFLEIIKEILFTHSIPNKFWSTRSQMIDNAILHHIMKI